MDKRTLLTIALIFLVLFVYQFFFFKPEPQQVQKQAKVEEKKDEPKPIAPVRPAVTKPVPSEEKEIKVETELYSAVFTTRGGTLKYYELKTYKDKSGKNVVLLKEPGIQAPLGIGSKEDFDLSDSNFHVSITGGDKDITLNKNVTSGSLKFEYADSGVSVKRTYTFHNDTYAIDVNDEVSGIPDYWITTGTDFGIYDSKDTSSHIGPVLLKESDRIEFDAKKLSEAKSYKEGLKWIAQEDKYFFASLVPRSSVEEAKVWQQKESPVIAFKCKSGTNSFFLFAGPKEYDRLKALKVGLEHIIDFGFFSIIAIPFFWVLKIFYKVLGNYGWAIVLLTLIVRIPFIPLVNKSQKSMKKMQEVQPKIAEIKEKYKKDPQKMQAEIMAVYKKHKVNPLGGCLPMLLQLPVFFALYNILLIAIELRFAPFILWIKDLSAPDTLLGHIPEAIPLIGGYAIGPLPLLMGATMVIQQKMTPTSMDSTQNKIMMLMPIVFTFIFLNFPSGLVLYWLMNNVFSIVQQFYVNRKLAKETKETV